MRQIRERCCETLGCSEKGIKKFKDLIKQQVHLLMDQAANAPPAKPIKAEPKRGDWSRAVMQKLLRWLRPEFLVRERRVDPEGGVVLG